MKFWLVTIPIFVGLIVLTITLGLLIWGTLNSIFSGVIPSVSPLTVEGEEITVIGIVMKNDREQLDRDGPAFLSVETEDKGIVQVLYHRGEAECKNFEALQSGLHLNEGAEIIAFGRVTGGIVETCGSERYFIDDITPIPTAGESVVEAPDSQTYRNEEFGFEFQYPALYTRASESRTGIASFTYKNGNYANSIAIEVSEENFEDFRILTPGGDLYHFDTEDKQWLLSRYRSEDKIWELISANELTEESRPATFPQKVEDVSIEAYEYPIGDGGCSAGIGVVPHSSYSFVVKISTVSCLQDRTADTYEEDLYYLDIKDIVSTFRFE